MYMVSKEEYEQIIEEGNRLFKLLDNDNYKVAMIADNLANDMGDVYSNTTVRIRHRLDIDKLKDVKVFGGIISTSESLKDIEPWIELNNIKE